MCGDPAGEGFPLASAGTASAVELSKARRVKPRALWHFPNDIFPTFPATATDRRP
jgi:hypothetical protein